MQQIIPSARQPIHAHIIIPGAKSITYRALLLAALSDGVSEITNIEINEGVRIFAEALNRLGVSVELHELAGSATVIGNNGVFVKQQVNLWCGDELLVARFLIAALAASPGIYHLDGSNALRSRRIEALINLVERQGATLMPPNATTLPLTLIGSDSLEGGPLFFDKKTHTQLISTLLMIAPFARSPFEFHLPDIADQRYIDMTVAMMAEFGVLVHRIHQSQYMVPVPQRYHARSYASEPDYSIANYFFAAAALTEGEISIAANTASLSKQTASQFLAILENMGCAIYKNENTIAVKGPKILKGIQIHISDSLDSLFALAALAPFAREPTCITYAGFTRKKDLNRINHFIIELEKSHILLKKGKHCLEIFPSKPISRIVNTHKDYRMIFAFAIIGLKVSGIMLDEIEPALQKFPAFWELWHKLAEGMNISA